MGGRGKLVARIRNNQTIRDGDGMYNRPVYEQEMGKGMIYFTL